MSLSHSSDEPVCGLATIVVDIAPDGSKPWSVEFLLNSFVHADSPEKSSASTAIGAGALILGDVNVSVLRASRNVKPVVETLSKGGKRGEINKTV